MAQIFFSYARVDRVPAERLVRALESHGFSVWWDPDITPGEDFEETIRDELNKASCVVVGWSKLSVKSPWVADEAKVGRDRGILVPVCFDDVSAPFGFGKIHTANLKDWNGSSFDPLITKLAEGIRRIIGGREPELAYQGSRSDLADARELALIQAEQEHWHAIRTSDNPQDFLAFLGAYRIGAFAAPARARLAQLQEQPASGNGYGEDPAAPDPSPFPWKWIALAAIGVAAAAAAWLLPSMGLWSLPNRPLTVAAEAALQPGAEFQECVECPRMKVIGPGEFEMGSSQTEIDNPQLPAQKQEGPSHHVAIAKPFAVGKFEVTFAQWDACAAGNGCRGYKPTDEGWGRQEHPVINVSWHDAKAYVAWLSGKTRKPYRLLSEAEWEYAARAGSSTRFYFGDEVQSLCRFANIADEALFRKNSNYPAMKCNDNFAFTAPAGQFAPNKFGLHDMLGNVGEWVEDPWHENYNGAPVDGSVWQSEKTENRVVRGGSFLSTYFTARSAARNAASAGSQNNTAGFRVARSLAW